MFQGAFNPNLSAYPLGRAPAIGVARGLDVDPISPGLQGQPGTLTATGPSRVVGGGMLGSYRGVAAGFGGVGYGGATGVVDADPVTPGIQAQPGVVTPIGPPRVISGPGAAAGAGFSSIARPGFGAVDADPITPGIQATPGVVTPVGPPQAVSQVGMGYGTAYPSQYGFCNNNCAACPWWVWTILGLLLLGALVGGLYSWGSRRERGLRAV